MQLARNFFLSTEKTLTRKLYEALLAFKIEHSLSKDQILELYVNQIYLGQRAYGFAAARRSTTASPWPDLTLAEAAMLAGLPKAPSSFNPVVNPQRAKQRQQYVLRRMHELGHINDTQYEAAQKGAADRARATSTDSRCTRSTSPRWCGRSLYEHYPEDVYSRGLPRLHDDPQGDQEAAYDALRRGVLEYDRRHGYRGPEGYVELPKAHPRTPLEEALAEYPGQRRPARGCRARSDGEAGEGRTAAAARSSRIPEAGLAASRRARSTEKTAPNRRIRRGAMIRVQKDEKHGWQILQLPEVEAAFVALDPQTGAMRALVGGFDFSRNKFNHVTQAWRQPGSSFKPFIYSASLEKGFTAATVVNDEPVVVEAALTGSQRWEPKNYDGKYEGPMRLRTALAKSKNMVSIRILQSIGPKYAQDYVTRFGFDADKHPPYLTMALGAGSVTPWQMARAYARVRERRLPDPAVPHPEDRRRPRQPARAGAAGEGRRRRPCA